MGADTKNIGGKAFGQFLLMLPDDEATLSRIFNYLDTHELKYEEVSEE